MPSFFKQTRGVQKMHAPAGAHKSFFHGVGFGFKKSNNYLSRILPQSWTNAAPDPVSSVFETKDCIWYHGTIYVKEAVAVARIQEKQVPEQFEPVIIYDDDDTESISSGNSAFKHTRSIGKHNQLKYLKDGMWLRHMILLNRATHEWNEWFATFDAEPNRIIRVPDGVAFDTLRQFARLHCNEALSTDASSANVWSDPHFQYQDMDGQWHPLSALKTLSA